MKTIIVLGAFLYCVALPADATDPIKQQTVQIQIRPECKDMFYGPDFVYVDANGKAIKKEIRAKPDYVAWDPARARPMSYKDPRTAISFYVESDGRHLAAIDTEGRLLWVRNPYEDKPAFCQYRTPRPVIDRLEAAEFKELDRTNLKARGVNLDHEFVAITFDSSQFGVLDETTGDFIPVGQN
jgi:hypothetical protein